MYHEGHFGHNLHEYALDVSSKYIVINTLDNYTNIHKSICKARRVVERKRN